MEGEGTERCLLRVSFVILLSPPHPWVSDMNSILPPDPAMGRKAGVEPVSVAEVGEAAQQGPPMAGH